MYPVSLRGATAEPSVVVLAATVSSLSALSSQKNALAESRTKAATFFPQAFFLRYSGSASTVAVSEARDCGLNTWIERRASKIVFSMAAEVGW